MREGAKMIVGIQGTKTFKNYELFLRGMGRALSALKPDDEYFTVMSVGTGNINAMAMEFINITERSLKSRGIKTRVNKVPPSWVKNNIHELDFFIYFCNPKEPYSDLYELARSKDDVEDEVYRL